MLTGKEKEKHQPRSKRVIELPISWGSSTTYLWLGGGNSNILHFSSLICEDDPIWPIFFKWVGWNHQLDIQTTIFCVQNLSFHGWSLAGSSMDPQWRCRKYFIVCKKEHIPANRYCWLFIRGHILLKLTWKNSYTFDCDIAEFLSTGSPSKKGQEQVPKDVFYALGRWWFHGFFWDVSLQFLLVAKCWCFKKSITLTRLEKFKRFKRAFLGIHLFFCHLLVDMCTTGPLAL